MQLPGLTIGIVADDMTGANDTALQFFPVSAPPHILLDLQDPPELPDNQQNQVWSINTQTRHADYRDAQARTRQAVALLRERYGVVNFYKKIDSTLRGNIAHECLGVLDELHAACAVIVPAYPQEGRRTVGGYQLVRGIPVERTNAGRDLLFPVRSSHIPTLLQHATTPDIVGHIELSTVLHGAGPLVVALHEQIREGRKLVVIDATSNEDLDQIALAIEKIQNSVPVLPCGSAGLAQALARLWSGEARITREKPVTSPSPILIVSGSNTEVTRNQLLQLMENYAYYGEGSSLQVFDLSPEQILALEANPDTVAQIVQALGERNTVILSTALKETNYARTQELAAERNIPEPEAARMAQGMLARITGAVLAHKSPKLILTGGEVAYHVCRGIGSRALRIVDEAEPSIPLTIDDQDRWIITKSGSFGSPMAVANLIKYIKQKEAHSVHA